MSNISVDKELCFALEMAKRTMYATNINGLDPNKFSDSEIQQYYHAYKTSVEYFNQIKGYIDYILYNRITVLNGEFENAIQDLNNYVVQINGVVSNLAIANDILSYLSKVIAVLGGLGLF